MWRDEWLLGGGDGRGAGGVGGWGGGGGGGGGRWRSRWFCLGPRELHACAAIDAHHHQVVFAAEDASLAARDHQVLPVGRVGGRDVLRVLVLRQRADVLAVGVDEPEVLVTASVADEDDGLSVWGVARLTVEAHPARDAGRLATGDRQGVQI